MDRVILNSSTGKGTCHMAVYHGGLRTDLFLVARNHTVIHIHAIRSQRVSVQDGCLAHHGFEGIADRLVLVRVLCSHDDGGEQVRIYAGGSIFRRYAGDFCRQFSGLCSRLLNGKQAKCSHENGVEQNNGEQDAPLNAKALLFHFVHCCVLSLI